MISFVALGLFLFRVLSIVGRVIGFGIILRSWGTCWGDGALCVTSWFSLFIGE